MCSGAWTELLRFAFHFCSFSVGESKDLGLFHVILFRRRSKLNEVEKVTELWGQTFCMNL